MIDVNSCFENKVEYFTSLIQSYAKGDIMVAFSGGVDSSVILKAATDACKTTGKKVYAITLSTMLHQMAEMENARKVAEEMNAIHMVLKVDELADAGIINNPKDRCYKCKKCLFTNVVKEAGIVGATSILEGTNEDDLHVYRPGIKAVRELGIESPLARACMTKKDVRRLAQKWSISTSNRPSTPCLATRFPYGTILSYEQMRNVESAEQYISSLGLYNVRVRIHNEIVRIEIDTQSFGILLENKNRITEYLKKQGYKYITLDLEGFRSGSMDID